MTGELCYLESCPAVYALPETKLELVERFQDHNWAKFRDGTGSFKYCLPTNYWSCVVNHLAVPFLESAVGRSKRGLLYDSGI